MAAAVYQTLSYPRVCPGRAALFFGFCARNSVDSDCWRLEEAAMGCNKPKKPKKPNTRVKGESTRESCLGLFTLPNIETLTVYVTVTVYVEGNTSLQVVFRLSSASSKLVFNRDPQSTAGGHRHLKIWEWMELKLEK